MRSAALTLCLLVFGLGLGCGPIKYISQVTNQASADVAAARTVEADKWAPYYYTLAVEYLRKAREEASFADFQAANRFGKRASRAAREARKLSVSRASDPEKAKRDLAPAGSASGLAPLDDDEPSDADDDTSSQPKGDSP